MAADDARPGDSVSEAVQAAQRVEEVLCRCLPISEDDHQAAHDFADHIGDDALLVIRAFLAMEAERRVEKK